MISKKTAFRAAVSLSIIGLLLVSVPLRVATHKEHYYFDKLPLNGQDKFIVSMAEAAQTPWFALKSALPIQALEVLEYKVIKPVYYMQVMGPLRQHLFQKYATKLAQRSVIMKCAGGKTDPHLVGFEGDRFDFSGEDKHIYNMLSDKDIQINTRMNYYTRNQPSRNWHSVMDQVGIQVGNDRLSYTVQGLPPQLNERPILVNHAYKLNNGMALWDGKKLTVQTKQYLLEFSVESDKFGQTASTNYLNQNLIMLQPTNPHGIIGQTADGDGKPRIGSFGPNANGEGIIEGSYKDYEVSSLFDNDFKFNRFNEHTASLKASK